MTDTSVIPTPATPDVCSISVLIDGDRDLRRVPRALGVGVQRAQPDPGRLACSSATARRPSRPSRQSTPIISCPARRSRSSSGTGRETRDRVQGDHRQAPRARSARTARLLSWSAATRRCRMTSGLKSRYFTDTTDGDILDELIGEYGLGRDVATTKPSLKEVVQYDSTDWDFLVCRAEANGHVVAVRDGKVTVGPPGDRRRARGDRPVRRDRARARRRDRRPLAGQGRQRHGLERHRPGARHGRCVRAVGDRQRQPLGGGPLRRDRRRPAPAPPRRQAQRAGAAGLGRRPAA